MSRTKLIFLIAALILAAASLLLLSQIANEPGPAQANWIGKELKVAKGDSWQHLGRRLKSEKLIRSLLWYKIQLRLRPNPATLKAGSYPWPHFMNTRQIIDYFQVARAQETYPLTIPEGLTRREVALLLERRGIMPARRFLEESAKAARYAEEFDLPFPTGLQSTDFTLEGYLFPDTYFLPKGYSASQLVPLMLQNFVAQLNKIEPGWREIPDFYSRLILSSIVQKEYRAAEEAPLIASVFQNRLNRGMKLESCATIVYVLTEELGRPHPNRILFRDLEEQSAYNTYLNRGLPPQPIASPGAIAIDAVFHQAQTDYLFFVVKDAAKGTHTFSGSFADHEAARASYIKNYFG